MEDILKRIGAKLVENKAIIQASFVVAAVVIVAGTSYTIYKKRKNNPNDELSLAFAV